MVGDGCNSSKGRLGGLKQERGRGAGQDSLVWDAGCRLGDVVSAARAPDLAPWCGELLEFLLFPVEKCISSCPKCILFIKLKTTLPVGS